MPTLNRTLHWPVHEPAPPNRPGPGRTRVSLVTAVTVAVALLALTGCGHSPAQPTGGPTSSSPVTSQPGRPGPAPTESNPSGDIPDSTQYVPYRAHGYEVKVPEGWARSDLPTGAGFTDKLNTIRIEAGPASSAPTEASARTRELPKIQASARNFKLRKIETIQRHGGTAVRIIYETDSAPDQVTGKVVRDSVERYEFFKAGQEAVLTLTGPVSADNVDPWLTVSDGFRWRA